jgi:hypothetical protein
VVNAMDANAKKVFAEAYATLDRVAHIEVEPRSHHDDPLTRWAVGMPKQPEPTPVSQARTLTDAETARWQAYVSDEIKRALAEYTELHREVLGAALAHERKLRRAEVEQLDLRLSALLGEVTKKQAVADGGVVELPALPLRASRRG